MRRRLLLTLRRPPFCLLRLHRGPSLQVTAQLESERRSLLERKRHEAEQVGAQVC